MATRNDILRYTMLPGFIPRIVGFFRSGFAHTAYIIAIIFSNVRLLDQNHPYLMQENFGRYGIRHVIAQASSNLVYSRRNIDQIIIFYTILVGMALLLLQFALVITALYASQPAFAFGVFTDFREMFRNPSATAGSLGPDQDIAFMVLDYVFGLGDGTAANNWYNSCVSNVGVACTDLNGQNLPSPAAYPFPFHDALHQLLRFYSFGILYVGAMVIIYLVIAIVAETAQTGVPFGQRFNKAWTPVRLIMFFALLMPLNTGGMNEGLNGAQLITFLVVKWGSNLATNAWSYFNTGAGGTNPYVAFLDDQAELVAAPQIPEVTDLLKNMFVIQTCRSAYAVKYNMPIDAYIVRGHPPETMGTIPPGTLAPLTPNAEEFIGTPYGTATDFVYEGNIDIVFGQLGTEDPNNAGSLIPEFENYKGNVKPVCGSITIQTQGRAETGSDQIFQGYYEIMQRIWTDATFIDRAQCLVAKDLGANQNPNCTPTLSDNGAWAEGRKIQYTGEVRTAVTNGITAQRAGGTFLAPPGILDRGWAGASIWYNRVAEMNGAVTTATLNIPKLSQLPLLMDNALRANVAENKDIDTKDLFDQNMANKIGLNVLFDLEDEDLRTMLSIMSEANDYWIRDGYGLDSTFHRPTNNFLIEAANSILGTEGIFEMRRNTDVHPLAQLTAIGRGMMENTLRNAAYGVALASADSLAPKQLGFEKAAAKSASGFFLAMVGASVAISIILYYVLPFLPFIYFMFALSGWLKSIFEAIVAMPLWALAHLRIDGEGLPGPGASNGYFLLLEIFLRPTLIIVGFVASISVFSAFVSVLNQIFDLVVSNVGGYDNELEQLIQDGAAAPKFIAKLHVARGPIDEFFFTAIYAIICYLMGLASFKLVDLIPNNILRWMGVSVSTFQENAGDPAGQLTSNVYRGANLTANQIRGQVQGDLALITS